MIEAPKDPDGRRWYTAQEIAKLLGVRPNTVYAWARDGRIEHVQPAGKAGNIWFPWPPTEQVKAVEADQVIESDVE